ncbi:MAG: DUF5703 domain-containing protein [Phycisphaerae bacterium]
MQNPKTPIKPLLTLAALAATLLPPILRAQDNVPANTAPSPAANDVSWSSVGKNENDSMPIGNGDLAANVWTESNGDLLLLVAKSDAWTETGKPVKLGRIRVKLSPNPFANAADFHQTLHVNAATIELSAGENSLRIWADASNPVLHVEGHLAQPATLQATAEFWRKTEPYADNLLPDPDRKVMAGQSQPPTVPDILFPPADNRLAWCHYNPTSIYPYVMRQEHLEAVAARHNDPFFHRVFGMALSGAGLTAADDHTLRAAAPSQTINLDLVALTQKNCDAPKDWLTAMDALVAQTKSADLAAARAAHEHWWSEFWDRSWIHLTGSDDAARVSQGYALQRYMLACSSRGELPPKFNGGLFTVGHDMPPTPAGAKPIKQTNDNHDPDYRAWGDAYWNQNERLLYWPLLATGDSDLLQPWFNLYLNALPLATDRNRLYYNHPGASFPETLLFWGVPRLADFGTDNPSFEIESRWQRFHIQGSLEVVAQMLDLYDQNGDATFAKKRLVPFANAIVTFYDLHYPRNAAKKLTLVPAQSLETYQLVAVNPTPDLAGLMDILPRLLALPNDLTTAAERTAWSRLLKELPPIPVGKTAKGKVPPFGRGDPDGKPTILPAELYGPTGNSENPELYVTFPYRLYGVGKPDLQLAQDTFAARRSPQNTCWGQDGPQSALLGLTDIARRSAVSYFSNYGDQRFKWFWKPAHDWIPDLDNGGNGMMTLQFMLMQCDTPPGHRIQLLPAWPKDWTADFKLHAPADTTIEGHVENGKLSNLKVTPETRAKDVVILPTQ